MCVALPHGLESRLTHTEKEKANELRQSLLVLRSLV